MNRKILSCISLGYLMLPLLIFFIGFVKLSIALPLLVLSLYSFYKAIDKNKSSCTFLSSKMLGVLFVVSILASWLSGIGAFFCQTGDFLVKNALLRDLCNHNWPLYIDLSKEPIGVQEIIGSEKVAFVYYLFFYLPAAACGKVGGELMARIVFLLWSALGIFLVLVNTVEFALLKSGVSSKNVLLVLTVLFAFGGLDIIGYLPHVNFSSLYSVFFQFPITSFVETWCMPYFRLWGGNIHDLAFVFNQCIPTWLITILILSRSDNKTIFFIYSFTLLYSPWATIGLFPIVLYLWVRGSHEKKFLSKFEFIETWSIQNILFPLCVLVIVASYYGANTASTGTRGWFFDFMTIGEFLIFYPLFLLVEIGIYIWFLRKDIVSKPILQVSLLVLLALPFYHITPGNDLLMRASIPALYVICVYWAIYVVGNFHRQKYLMVTILFFTSFSSTHTYTEAFSKLVQEKKIHIEDPIGSFFAIDTKQYADMCDFQFFSHDYSNTFFFKYIAK